jgi:two-component system, chemotaxis family, chemotaxis protein CheY
MKSFPPADSATRVLVVDADTESLETLRETLAAEGFHVLTATNRHQAAARVLEDGIDIVLMNMLMPRAEGIGTIIAVRAIRPEMGIIAMSGTAGDGADHFMPLAKSLGATALLRDPSDRGALVDAVRSALAAGMERLAC